MALICGLSGSVWSICTGIVRISSMGMLARDSICALCSSVSGWAKLSMSILFPRICRIGCLLSHNLSYLMQPFPGNHFDIALLGLLAKDIIALSSSPTVCDKYLTNIIATQLICHSIKIAQVVIFSSEWLLICLTFSYNQLRFIHESYVKFVLHFISWYFTSPAAVICKWLIMISLLYFYSIYLIPDIDFQP